MVEPVELGLKVEDVTLKNELPRELTLIGRSLQASHIAQRAQGRATLGLDHGLNVDRGVGGGHSELHHKLITFGMFARNRGGPPGGEDFTTDISQLKDLGITARIGLSVRDDLAVALEALHRLVDLADVQRPCSARLLLEHLLQAVDTGGLLRNKRQQGIANRHNSPFVVWTCRRSWLNSIYRTPKSLLERGIGGGLPNKNPTGWLDRGSRNDGEYRGNRP